MPRSIYLIGSLRNPRIPDVAAVLRRAGHDVFDDWYAAGPTADDSWQAYEQGRGRTYLEALRGLAADHVFQFDRRHLDRCDTGVLVMPAGKSAHIELGYCIGKGKQGYVLFDKEPERWDVMYGLATGFHYDVTDLIGALAPPARSWLWTLPSTGPAISRNHGDVL